MKKIAKVLLTLGVLLAVPAGLSAGPTLVFCFKVMHGHFVSLNVPSQAVGVFEAHGWVCEDPDPPCIPPGCGGGGA